MSEKLKRLQVSKEKLYELVKEQFPDVKLPSVDKMVFRYADPTEERSWEFQYMEDDEYLLEYLNNTVFDYSGVQVGICLLSNLECLLSGFSFVGTDVKHFNCHLDYAECLEFFTAEQEQEESTVTEQTRKTTTKRRNLMDAGLKAERDRKIADFKVKQQQSYEFKVAYARTRAREFVNECYKRDLDYHVSVGGLDSITLFLFLKSIGISDAIGISCSYLEDKSIIAVHKQLGIECIEPLVKEVTADGKIVRWTKNKVIQEFGFPVLSKEIAQKIETLAHPTEDNKTVRHAIMTGETGELGGFQKHSRMKLSDKWLQKFGGYGNEYEGTNYEIPDFKVSSKCCYYLKEKPCDDWAKEHNSVPFLGLMASEGGRRAKSLMINGCNYFGKSTIRSCPFAIFNRQDLLQLALDLNVPVPEIYGEIKRRPDGTLYTTKAQRTGCSMCGFGIQMEKRPHRFDLLYDRNPKEWEYLMFHYCKDSNGNDFGWSKVLDYIGVGWQPEEVPPLFR